MPIRAVVFDLFDTLVDLSLDGLPRVRVRDREIPSSLGVLHARIGEVTEIGLERLADELGALDRELRQSRHRQGRELPTRERFERLCRRLPGIPAERVPELAEGLTQAHMGLLREQVGYLEHHPEVVEALSHRVKLAVCSNFSHSQTALRVLEEAQLRWSFDAVVISDTTGFRKPRPEIFRATFAALGVVPSETLHVGDNLRADVAGAAAVGARTAWVTRRVEDPDRALREHEGPAPDLVVTDLAELLDQLP